MWHLWRWRKKAPGRQRRNQYFPGTIPWLYSEGGSATTDADHVTLTSDLKGARPTGSETDKRLYSGDKLTVSWEIGDTEGDVDLGGLGDNAKTIDTIRWMSYKDAQGAIRKSWQRR